MSQLTLVLCYVNKEYRTQSIEGEHQHIGKMIFSRVTPLSPRCSYKDWQSLVSSAEVGVDIYRWFSDTPRKFGVQAKSLTLDSWESSNDKKMNKNDKLFQMLCHCEYWVWCPTLRTLLCRDVTCNRWDRLTQLLVVETPVHVSISLVNISYPALTESPYCESLTFILISEYHCCCCCCSVQ